MNSDINFLRLIDAAANRAREGLRVAEDYVRFILDDKQSTEFLKRFRHSFTELMSEIPLEHRAAARETRQDVGTGISLDSERRRADLTAVLTANFTRLQESLRSLEEYSKVVCPQISSGLEQLRYDSYTLQKMVFIQTENKNRLPHQGTIQFVQPNSTPDFTNGEIADYICLKADLTADCDFLTLYSAWKNAVAPRQKLLIILNRCDLVAVSNANGVLLKQSGLNVRQAREILPQTALVGVQIENEAQLQLAQLDGADWVQTARFYPEFVIPQALEIQ